MLEIYKINSTKKVISAMKAKILWYKNKETASQHHKYFILI